MSNATTARKTSKAQAREAIDRFFWFLNHVTGGTSAETFAQAPGAIARMEELAGNVADLFANQSKLLLADSHLQDMAARIPARLERYRASYVTPAMPSNIIPFNR